MSQLNMSLVTTTSVLSMLGALLIIITFVAFRDVRTPLRKIIVFLSIADFVEAFGNLFGLMMPPVAPPDVDWPCRLQSFLTSSSALSSFLWSVIVAYYLYMALVKGNPEVVERQLLLVHVVCWGFPLTLNGVLLYMKKLGNSRDAMTAGWCWIHVKANSIEEQRRELITWMLVDGKLVEISCYFIVMILYSAVRFEIRKQLVQHDVTLTPSAKQAAEVARAADRKLLIIPILFIVLRLWGTIRFFMFIAGRFNKDEASLLDKILISLQGIGDSAQGFVNCILFCVFTTKVRRHLINIICCIPAPSHINERAALLRREEPPPRQPARIYVR